MPAIQSDETQGMSAEPQAGVDRELVNAAIAGDRAAVQRLVARLTPVIQARVARCVLRYRPRGGHVRQDVDDLSQDVFLRLFEDGGRVLQTWDPGRGLSLENFAGLVAERLSISSLRTGKRNPWREDAAEDEVLAAVPSVDATPAEEVASVDFMGRLHERLRETLTPLGMHLFHLLYVEERSVEEVCTATALSADAVYAWRSRLRRTAQGLCRELLSEAGPAARIPELR
jgi:RNA polymerase sigma-70 factor (ECF subfamily)